MEKNIQRPREVRAISNRIIMWQNCQEGHMIDLRDYQVGVSWSCQISNWTVLYYHNFMQ